MAQGKLNSQDYQLRFKKGLAANINTTVTKNLAIEGEPHWTTDTNQLHIFDGTQNLRVPTANQYGGIDLSATTENSSVLTLKTTDDDATNKILEIQDSSGGTSSSINSNGRIYLETKVAHNSNTPGIKVVNNDTSGLPMLFLLENYAASEGMRFEQNTVMGGGKSCFALFSNQAHTNGDAYLLKCENLNSSANQAMTKWINASSDSAFEIEQRGNNAAVEIQQTSTGGDAHNLRLIQPAGASSKFIEAIGNWAHKFVFNADGYLAIGHGSPSALIDVRSSVSSDKVAVFRGAASQSANLTEWQDSNGNVLKRINKDGVLILKNTSAPADGDLDNSEMAFWLDDTNGAGKMMIKAKTADGTVVTGSVEIT